jgi:type III pantothenate kinase
MDWLFDLGNTRLKCAPLTAAGVGTVQALAHDGVAPPEGLPRGGTAWLASVVPPPLAQALAAALGARFDRVRNVHTLPALGRLRIAYREPSRLGVDRFLAMLGALQAEGGGPWLVVGVGTALAIDALGADGQHLGGRIAPSPALMRAALHARVPHLPGSGGIPVDFADDSADALASGCEGAALALVEDSRGRARAAFGTEPALLLHGGGADAVAARLPAAVLRPALVLEGLACWARLRPQ